MWVIVGHCYVVMWCIALLFWDFSTAKRIISIPAQKQLISIIVRSHMRAHGMRRERKIVNERFLFDYGRECFWCCPRCKTGKWMLVKRVDNNRRSSFHVSLEMNWTWIMANVESWRASNFDQFHVQFFNRRRAYIIRTVHAWNCFVMWWPIWWFPLETNLVGFPASVTDGAVLSFRQFCRKLCGGFSPFIVFEANFRSVGRRTLTAHRHAAADVDDIFAPQTSTRTNDKQQWRICATANN